MNPPFIPSLRKFSSIAWMASEFDKLGCDRTGLAVTQFVFVQRKLSRFFPTGQNLSRRLELSSPHPVSVALITLPMGRYERSQVLASSPFDRYGKVEKVVPTGTRTRTPGSGGLYSIR